MSGEPPQAGNGAGKSRRRGQWKDCRSVARHVSTVDGDHRGPFLVRGGGTPGPHAWRRTRHPDLQVNMRH